MNGDVSDAVQCGAFAIDLVESCFNDPANCPDPGIQQAVNCFNNQDEEKVIMKKLAVPRTDVTSLISNVLIVSAVAAAATPLLLGDQLVVIVSDVARQASLLLQEVSISLQGLLS